MLRSLRAHTMVLSALLALTACSPSERAGASSDVPTLVGEVVGVAHSDTSAEAIELYQIAGLALAPDGRIAVTEASSHGVLLFDSAGALIQRIGREGSGPGELVRPCCLNFLTDSELAVLDIGNRRYSIFAVEDPSSPEIGRTIRLPAGTSGWSFRIERLSDTSYSFLTSGGMAVNGGFRLARVVLDTSGAVLSADTVSLPTPDSLGHAVVTREIPGGVSTSTFAPPFPAVFLFAPSVGAGYAEGVSGTYVVHLRDTGGQLKRDLLGSSPKVPVSPGEAEEARETVRKLEEAVPELRGRLKVPATKPPLSWLGTDHDGRLWIGLSTAQDSSEKADVYSSEGELLFRATWPSGVDLRLAAIRGERGVGERLDDDGIETLVLLRFVRSGDKR